MKKLIYMVIMLTCYNVTYAQSGYNQELQKAAKEIAQKITASGKKNVAVLNFENSNNQISELGSWLAGVFTTHLENNSVNEFSVKNRSDIEKAIQQIKTESGSGAFDSKTIQRLGEISGSDVIVYGELTLMDNEITVNIRTKNTSLNSSVGGVLITFAATDGMRTKYDNYIETSITTSGSQTNASNSASREGTARTSKNPDCKEKKIGDYCFQNKTKFDLDIIISPIGVRRLTCNLQPGQKQCFYDLSSGTLSYEIIEKDFRSAYHGWGVKPKYQEKGQLYIETCKEKIFIIK